MTRIIRRGICGLLAAVLAATASPALADGNRNDPLARFEAPLCPGVVGLELESALAMVSRIRDNAEQFGVRLAPEGDCEPNMIVAFLEDGQDYLRRLADEKRHLFDSLSRAELRDLLDESGPARAWISSDVRTRDGMWIGHRQSLDHPPQARMMSAHSRIYVPIRRDIASSMVLIDRDAVEGLTVGQLADYATLRGLAQTVPEPQGEAGSITAIFDQGENAPSSLTEFDQAYLSRLYASIPNLPASTRLQNLPE